MTAPMRGALAAAVRAPDAALRSFKYGPLNLDLRYGNVQKGRPPQKKPKPCMYVSRPPFVPPRVLPCTYVCPPRPPGGQTFGKIFKPN